MTRHTESIVVFGYVIPFFFAAVLTGGVFYGRSQLQDTETRRSKVWEEYAGAAKEADAVESLLAAPGRRAMMVYWDECLKKEFIQNLTQNLNEIQQRFNEEQMVQTELSRPQGRSSFASRSENPYTRFKISFSGGIGPIQIALAELERRMPQIVLDDLQIKPKTAQPDSPASLTIEATYLSWQDKKSTTP